MIRYQSKAIRTLAFEKGLQAYGEARYWQHIAERRHLAGFHRAAEVAGELARRLEERGNWLVRKSNQRFVTRKTWDLAFS